jgi:cell division protein FtsW (lipid II flippase)
MISPRLRELFALIPVTAIVSAGVLAVLITRTDDANDLTLTYGAVFLGLCVFGHLFIRARLPDADPYLFPLAALLSAVGLVMIYRIDADQAGGQALFFVLGLVLLVLTVLFLRDIHALERYRYTIAAAGIVLLLLPRVPGIGKQVNGAYLGIGFGSASFQPAEFAKLAIIIFLASYLRDTADVLLGSSRNARWWVPWAAAGVAFLLGWFILGVGIAVTVLLMLFAASLTAVIQERPSLKHFGPMLLIWGLAMIMLIFIRDLGSSLMFFGGFLGVLYIATGRLSLVGVGATMFLGGATFFANNVSHVADRITVWRTPFKRGLVDDEGYQIAQSMFAQADGGLFGQGFGQALLELPGGGRLLPAADTDLIYAVVVNEVGLFGGIALLLAYLLFVVRGFKTALQAPDDFSKLLAAGLTAVFALQVFVIIGGVTRVIPLTGVTMPFVSYGGSSIIANMVLLALLLIVSDEARRQRSRRGGLV